MEVKQMQGECVEMVVWEKVKVEQMVIVVGIIPLSSPPSHVTHRVTMTQCYPVDVPTLNSGLCTLQLCI